MHHYAVYPRHSQDIPKTFPRHSQDIPKTFLPIWIHLDPFGSYYMLLSLVLFHTLLRIFVAAGPPAPPGGCGDSVRQFAHSVHVRFGARAVGRRLRNSKDGWVLCVCVPWSPFGFLMVSLKIMKKHLGYPWIPQCQFHVDGGIKLGTSRNLLDWNIGGECSLKSWADPFMAFNMLLMTAWMRALGLWWSLGVKIWLQDHGFLKVEFWMIWWLP